MVFNHIALPLAGDDLPSPLRVWLIEYGGLGIQVFFAISGFVIAHSLRKVRMDTGEFRNYAARRFARISPPYYAALILALVVSYTSAQFKAESWAFPSPGRFLAHLVYLPDLLDMEMINGVHWTLFLEVQFYLLFALVLWLIAPLATRWRHADQIVMTAVGAVALLYPLFDLRNGREHYFLPYCFAFVLGVFVQWYVTGRLRREIFCTYLALLGVAWVVHGDSLVGCRLRHRVDHPRLDRGRSLAALAAATAVPLPRQDLLQPVPDARADHRRGVLPRHEGVRRHEDRRDRADRSARRRVVDHRRRRVEAVRGTSRAVEPIAPPPPDAARTTSGHHLKDARELGSEPAGPRY